jgi:ABC-2 type transport system ATP-binding protein
MNETATPAVEIERVTKTYGTTTAVDDLSLVVPRGAAYGFIGPNGSGKTTTLRMIMNILYPDRGGVRVFGDTLRGSSTDRIGYMPEERGLYRKMRVRDLLEFYGGLKGNGDVVANVTDWLDRLELAEWADKKIETLSKGMSQKVQFIATVVARPELVILDEPFTGLDPVNTEVIRNAILGLQAEGTTVIFSTHDMSMAEKMCDFIFMIFRGRKVLDGTLSSIQDEYGSDTIRLRTGEGAERLRTLPGIEHVTDFGQVQELRIARDCDPQQLLGRLVGVTTITSFEITRPSLHDIFVRIAGPSATEVTDA